MPSQVLCNWSSRQWIWSSKTWGLIWWVSVVFWFGTPSQCPSFYLWTDNVYSMEVYVGRTYFAFFFFFFSLQAVTMRSSPWVSEETLDFTLLNSVRNVKEGLEKCLSSCGVGRQGCFSWHSRQGNGIWIYENNTKNECRWMSCLWHNQWTVGLQVLHKDFYVYRERREERTESLLLGRKD